MDETVMKTEIRTEPIRAATVGIDHFLRCRSLKRALTPRLSLRHVLPRQPDTARGELPDLAATKLGIVGNKRGPAWIEADVQAAAGTHCGAARLQAGHEEGRGGRVGQ